MRALTLKLNNARQRGTSSPDKSRKSRVVTLAMKAEVPWGLLVVAVPVAHAPLKNPTGKVSDFSLLRSRVRRRHVPRRTARLDSRFLSTTLRRA